MALTAAQLVTLATQIGKGIKYTSQAGQFLNMILSDLAQLNDFELSQALFQINTATPTGVSVTSGVPFYNLAADHLHVLKNGVFYLINGVPYNMIQKEMDEFDNLISTQGFSAQMVFYAIDDSLSGDSNSRAVIYFWPPANGQYTVNVRYAKLRPDIATPETSNTVPWFPEQSYLLKKLSAYVCHLTNDDRADKFEKQAEDILRQWLPMQRDLESSTICVELDRKRYSTPYTQLRNTKTVGF